MTTASNSIDRRVLCLQLALGALTGQVANPEDVVKYADVLSDYLVKGKSSPALAKG